MPIKSKVFIQTYQSRKEISSSFGFDNKNTKKVFLIAFFGWGRFALLNTFKVKFRQCQH